MQPVFFNKIRESHKMKSLNVSTCNIHIWLKVSLIRRQQEYNIAISLGFLKIKVILLNVDYLRCC